MLDLSHKAKQYLLVALKLLILGVTFWYIYNKLNSYKGLDWHSFLEKIITTDNLWLYLSIFLTLAFLNWFFEIIKWKLVVTNVRTLSFFTATKQSLVALMVSLATPNRVGDYGAKAYFYPSKDRKKILLNNFFINGIQMAVTCFFGIVGLILISKQYNLEITTSNIILLFVVVTGLLLLGYLLKEKQLLIKGFSISNVMRYYKGFSVSVKLKTLFISLLRYFIFSTLFFILLHFFEAKILYQQAFPLIFAMYFLVSIIPSVFIFDVVIRGGVAVWLFSFAGVNELTILSTVLSMWLLNFILPALIGAVLMFTYKPQRS